MGAVVLDMSLSLDGHVTGLNPGWGSAARHPVWAFVQPHDHLHIKHVSA